MLLSIEEGFTNVIYLIKQLKVGLNLKRTISGITLTLLLIGTFLAFNFVIAKLSETESIKPVIATGKSVRQGVDWWPMFHHNLQNTGYSTSTAPNTNNTLWNYTTDGNVFSSPAVADGKVYVGSYDYRVYCLNATTGVQIWNYTTGNNVQSSPIVADGKVYVGSDDHRVYCLNATTGAHIWDYPANGNVRSSPAVADGKVYVGSGDDRVYCLNASTGVHIWN